jgi:hypothetical protein
MRPSLLKHLALINQLFNPSVMSLSIFEYGDGRFRLFHGEREVGWVEGRAVGFVGFDSEAGAVHGATVAYDALSGWLARQSREQPTPRPRRRLGIRIENGEHHLTLGGVAIGRLVCGSEDHIAASASHGFELTLPPRIGAALSAAQIIDQALTRYRQLRELETADAIGASEAVV